LLVFIIRIYHDARSSECQIFRVVGRQRELLFFSVNWNLCSAFNDWPQPLQAWGGILGCKFVILLVPALHT